MKRLFIAIFLLISTVAVLSGTHKDKKNIECSQKMCCMKKCNKTPNKIQKAEYIFWEPIGRLMMITL